MATRYGAHINKTGLALYWDAAYPGSGGSVVPDLSGNGRNGAWSGTPIWASNNGGVFRFNTSNVILDTTNFSSGTSTVIASARYTGGTAARIVSASNNNWLLGHWSANVANYFAEGWVTAAGAGGLDTVWRIYAGTADVSGDSYSFYINGNLDTGPSSAGSAGPNALRLGGSGLYGETSNGEVGFVMIYTRVLPLDEIQTIYKMMRGRYGIS